jgi:4-hydroxysphinganine ceramide fatty acyl 2-hydroxylase
VGLFGLYRVAFGFAETRLIVAITLVAAALLAPSAAAPAVWLPAALAAVVAWGLTEYVLHRFVLHMPQPSAQWLAKLHARLHASHHREPDDPRLLFVPAWAAVQLFALAFGVAFAFGGQQAALGATLGLGVTFFLYETTHLAAHVSYRPRTRWGRFMKRFHLLHHFKNERYWFGVTHPLVDLVARTWPAHEQIEKSSTARTLGIDGPA